MPELEICDFFVFIFHHDRLILVFRFRIIVCLIHLSRQRGYLFPIVTRQKRVGKERR